MDWVSKNWIWVVVVFAVLLMFRHHGGWGIRHRHQRWESGRDEDAAFDRQERSRDPVSGEQVDTSSAINSTYQGRTYYFGSRENRDKFEAAPAQYAPATPANIGTHRHRRHGC